MSSLMMNVTTTMGATVAPVLTPDEGMGNINSIWILICAYFVFTMQIGFALLEVGSSPSTYLVNGYFKCMADVIIGGTVYWLIGYSFAFGDDPGANGFVGYGDFSLDVAADSGILGYTYVNFVYQISFASAGATILSGAVAGRLRLYAYFFNSVTFNIIYSIVSHWLWAPGGWLHLMGGIDASGSGVVHLCGGAAALAAVFVLGPRTGRFAPGAPELPPSNAGYIVLGTFYLWWGWLGFNSGGAFGITGGVWKIAARCAVTTTIAAITAGCSAVICSKIKNKNFKIYNIPDACNGALGGLVAITAPCTTVRAWEACIIGLVAGALVVFSGAIFNRLRIDDPIGVFPVHFMNGAWGLIACGVFTNNDPYTHFNTNGVVGLFNGGGFYLIGVQALAVICIIAWTMAGTFFVFGILRMAVGIRLDDEEQAKGPDATLHSYESQFVRFDHLKANFPNLRTPYDDASRGDALNGWFGKGKDENVLRRKQVVEKPLSKSSTGSSTPSSSTETS